jgi:hypothetical protein
MSDAEMLSLEQAKRRYHEPLTRVVLEWLSIMDRVVNQPKQPEIPAEQWDDLAKLMDTTKFRRVGNYGVKNDWTSYKQLLTQWANHSWWKGYIWRVREVPGSSGDPSLVYMETEERSNIERPVTEDGEYKILGSIAVYEFDANGKVTAIHVYDQRPL